MLNLNLDTKLIVVAVFGLLVLAAVAGAAIYHETTIGRLRGELEKERAGRREALVRGEQLEGLVRESAAEVEAAKRAAAVAQKQAKCTGLIGRAFDRARKENREVVHEVRNAENTAPNLDASLASAAAARALYWARVNALFLRRPVCGAPADREPGPGGLCAADAPGLRADHDR